MKIGNKDIKFKTNGRDKDYLSFFPLPCILISKDKRYKYGAIGFHFFWWSLLICWSDNC